MLVRVLQSIIIILYCWFYFYLYSMGIFYYGNFVFSFCPEFTFLYLFIGLLIYGLFVKMTKDDCFSAYTAITILTVYRYCYLLENGNFHETEHYSVTELCIYIKIAVLLIVYIILWVMLLLEDKYSEIHLNFEFLCIVLLCIFGIFIFLSTNNLFFMYLGIELQSLAIYILCCWKRSSIKSVEASLKYFIFGSFASLILLLGISLLYLFFGILNIYDINLLIISDNFSSNDHILLLYIGLVFILAGFFFKLAIVPFHWWLVEIFEGSPDIIVFFLAVVPKLPFFFVLYKLNKYIFINFFFFSYIFIICGLLSVIIGTILALYTIKIKKLLAYSSIVHMGYIIIGLGLGTPMSITFSFYYFIIYLLLTINIFCIFLLLRSSYYNIFGNITDFSHLKNSDNLLALMTIVSLLSLAGIPPFMGFFGKLFIFNLLIASGNYFICLLLLLSSILSCVYYIRLIRFIYFDDRTEEPIAFKKIKHRYIYIFISCFFLLNLVFLFIQEPLLLYLIYLFS